jgi:hypothetical protein
MNSVVEILQMAANLLKELRVQHTLDTCTLNHALSVLTLSNRVHQVPCFLFSIHHDIAMSSYIVFSGI